MNPLRPRPQVCRSIIAALFCVGGAGAMSHVTSAAETEPKAELPVDGTRYNYPQPATPGASLPAEALEAAVARELAHDPLIDAEDIEVAANGHIITLGGTQRLLIAKERATYVAETVRGVREVINDIRIDTERAVDAQRLEADIRYALRTDPATEHRQFTVAANDRGNVVIGGTVESGAERAIAENIVKSIAGVRSLVNKVQLVRAQDRSDKQIYADVIRMLQWDAYVDSTGIQVAVEDGVVTLDGVVGTPAEKRRAVGLSWVAGVEHVNVAPLEVRAAERDRPTQKPTAGAQLELRSDEAIAEAVRRALAREPRVSLADIDVSVEDRVVTLKGTVDTLRAKRIAAGTPYGILGVASVRDQLRLPKTGEQNGEYIDEAIQLRVQRLLDRNSLLEDDSIVAVVNDRVVTLQGTAGSRYARALAGDIAGSVRGVMQVRNALELELDQDARWFSYDPYVDADGGVALPFEYPTADEGDAGNRTNDRGIAESVRAELWWSPFVDEQDITVSSRSAVVTLAGTVDSEAERRAAIENAFEGGAISVKSELVVADAD